MSLEGKTVLITGAAVRVGRSLALGVARAGGDVALHYAHSKDQALSLQSEIQALGRQAYLLQADLADPRQARELVPAARQFAHLYALVNNAAIFEALELGNTTLEAWERHFAINLTAPFLLSQAFAAALEPGESGRIVNILDWRALRPGKGHLPYTTSKAGLAALTRQLAVSLAPQVSVNGLALGAILPPSTGEPPTDLLQRVPAGRWGELAELAATLLFLLDGPEYITGEILHLDGGRHLV